MSSLQRPQHTFSGYHKNYLGFGIFKVLLFMLFHFQLGVLMVKLPILGTVHAYALLGAGILTTLISKRPEHAAYFGAYLMGSEVLWRMTQASVLWEFGKYSVVLIFFIAILKRGVRNPGLPIFYFLLLIPSIFMHATTVIDLDRHATGVIDLDRSRKLISFNLSGPLALMVSVLFFSKLKLDPLQLRKLWLAALGPIISILSIARFHTFAQENIQFIKASMAETSGGFGANQVSAVLGLGAFFAFFYVMDGKQKFLEKTVISIIGLLLAVQSALTFSRGGLYCAGTAIALASFFMVRNRKVWARYFFTAVILAVIVFRFAIPYLVEFTGGKITDRFKETQMSNRESLFADDLKVWQEHPFLGVGPGLAMYHREIYAAAHTEFSRLPAEHGLFGILSILILIRLAFVVFARAQTPRQKALTASLIAWSFLFMVVNAMRIAAPAFIFGLASAQFIDFNLRMPSANRAPAIKEEKA